MGTEKERKKARLVALGHLDRLKDYIINLAPTLMRYALRVILSIASMFGMQVYSSDVKQAYIQADTPLQRPVYMYPPKGYKDIRKGMMLKLNKPLHGMTEAGSYWFDTYHYYF